MSSSHESFQIFLQSECAAIAALVDELIDHDRGQSVEEEKINLKIRDQISQYSKLKSYYAEEAADEFE
jgi:hypothetical protein